MYVCVYIYIYIYRFGLQNILQCCEPAVMPEQQNQCAQIAVTVIWSLGAAIFSRRAPSRCAAHSKALETYRVARKRNTTMRRRQSSNNKTGKARRNRRAGNAAYGERRCLKHVLYNSLCTAWPFSRNENLGVEKCRNLLLSEGITTQIHIQLGPNLGGTTCLTLFVQYGIRPHLFYACFVMSRTFTMFDTLFIIFEKHQRVRRVVLDK